MDMNESGLLAYRRKKTVLPVIVELARRASYDILITTPEEEAGARNLIDEKHIPFDYFRT